MPGIYPKEDFLIPGMVFTAAKTTQDFGLYLSLYFQYFYYLGAIPFRFQINKTTLKYDIVKSKVQSVSSTNKEYEYFLKYHTKLGIRS
jgi:hypothetical protein